MLLLLSRSCAFSGPRPSLAFSSVIRHRCCSSSFAPVAPRCVSQFSSHNDQTEVPVEISPSDHGTRPLTRLSKGIDGRLVKALQSQGLTTPTPIQAHAIPLLQIGLDVMASAQTGSGKTLMFSLPLCERLLQRNTLGNFPSALILCPTRELAMQTANVLRNLSAHTPLRIALTTGGAHVGSQRQKLKKSDILVGTPGRVLQFVDERTLSLISTTEVVVDEADRMLDLGFEPQLRRIARALGRNKQRERHTALCSATFPPQVQRVASEFLKQDYYFVAAGRVGATHKGISQTLQWVDGGLAERRKAALAQVHRYQANHKGNARRAIVFCNTKDEAERLGASLKGSVRVVHGDKEQSERNKSLEAFRNGKVQTLVATDVAARGLDVAGIGLVVQVDAPRDVDSYVHRVGRTGRAGEKGQAVAFLDGRCVGISQGLVRLMQESSQTIPSWLFGMAHVAKMRTIEEEGAIAAGGGGALDMLNRPDSTLNETSGEQFSAQDFRSGAVAGSWGSERDTSYHSFDEEAYSSLSDGVVPSITDTGKAKRGDQSEAETNMGGDALMNDDKLKSDAFPAPEFKRQKPSSELLQAINRITGSKAIGEKPVPKVLKTLSKRGANQKLRFEYLGMFPFEKVSGLLASRGRSDRNSDRRNDMPRVLMVAEKPSIAEAIANALSGPNGPRKRRGISHALPVYEVTSNSFVPSQVVVGGDAPTKCLLTVTSVIGHVFSLGFVEEKTEGYPDPSEYFHMPVVKREEGSTGKLRVVEHLRALAADSDHLVLWLDCDAEGENIAHEVVGVTRRALEQKAVERREANPDAPSMRRVHRARFSAITKDALRDAFRNLVEPDAALSRSVDARQELDLRVGVALTRLLTWRFVGLARRHFSPTTKIVSYGPCQTPALSFCVDRAREIEAFQPQDYWKAQITAKMPGDGKETVPLRWKVPAESAVKTKTSRKGPRKESVVSELAEESASFDQMAAQQVAELASAPNTFATLVRVDNISERIIPPVGLNTVALLTAGSKAMGMSPKQVMNVAEKLYSAGFISYPRTETTRYDPNGFDVRSVLREHSSHPEWGRTASFLLRTKYANTGRPPRRGHDAGDHPPITCSTAATRDEVGGGAAWRVYEFVCRNFLGSLGDELSFTRQVAELELDVNAGSGVVSAERPRFELERVHVDSLGFAGACRWVLRDIQAADKDSHVVFQEGMRLPIADAHCERRATKPPRFLQEHELIECMDTNRIGTDASMATHVTNIVDRGYVALCDETGVPLRPPMKPRPGQPRRPRQVGRYLVPTPLGISLLDLFGQVGAIDGESPAMLSRPAIRAQMEAEVKQIALGKLDKAECVEQNLDWFESRYNELAGSLSRQRVDEFARALRPMKDSLRYWQRLGAFEPAKPGQHLEQSGRRANSKKAKRAAKGGAKRQNKRLYAKSGGGKRRHSKTQ